MTNAQITKLYNLLTTTDFDNIFNKSFQYAIIRNIDILEPIFKSINKLIESNKSNRFIELNNEMELKINKELSKIKDKTYSKQEYIVIENRLFANWDKLSEWNILVKKHSDMLEEINIIENDIKLHALKYEDIPDLNNSQMNAIYMLIQKSDENIK